MLGVKFAPLNVPLERRFQTLAVLFGILDFLVIGWVVLFALVYLLFTSYYYVSLLYFTWWLYDRQTPNRGGFRFRPGRRFRFFRGMRDYFPTKVVKTAEIDPSRNYILGVHPHGVFSLGIVVNFGSDATGVDSLFPGVTIRTLTLEENFILPLHRELALLTGACSVTRESMEWLLTKEGKGNALTLVPGGVAEALEASAGTCNLTLKSRKGFVRMALKHGADLVPVFSFGENELYSQSTGPFLKWLQGQVKRVTRFVPVMIFGRGVFQYTFGVLPYRRPVTAVIGSPIRVEQVPEPTKEQIDELHQKYCDGLLAVYNKYKDEYGTKGVNLVIN